MSLTHHLGLLARLLAVPTLCALAGCYAETTTEPAYVDATVAPVEVDTAPSYVYEGRTVYYVNDHWYARDRGRWVYYRTEPEQLYRQRITVQRAPRAPERPRVRREEAPRVEHIRREEAPRAEHIRREEAPRAERVE